MLFKVDSHDSHDSQQPCKGLSKAVSELAEPVDRLFNRPKLKNYETKYRHQQPQFNQANPISEGF